MPTRSERRRSRVRLTVAEVEAAQEAEAAAAAPEFPLLPVALIAGAASALAGWLLVAGLVMVGWFTAMAMPVPTALGFAGQFWLAGHGVGAAIGSMVVTLTPLGLSALFVLLARTVTGLGLRATSTENLDGRGALRAWRWRPRAMPWSPSWWRWLPARARGSYLRSSAAWSSEASVPGGRSGDGCVRWLSCRRRCEASDGRCWPDWAR